MQFKDLTIGSEIYVFHSNNTMEKETIKELSSHNGFITMRLIDSSLHIRAQADKSIYFDEENDVVLFTEKHRFF